MGTGPYEYMQVHLSTGLYLVCLTTSLYLICNRCYDHVSLMSHVHVHESAQIHGHTDCTSLNTSYNQCGNLHMSFSCVFKACPTMSYILLVTVYCIWYRMCNPS